MIQIQWYWSNRDDPDPVMLIQQRWSRSSDDPDIVMMIQIEWWSRSRWRWIEDEDDEDSMMIQMIQRRRLVLSKLCWENTFLVKRECWCICNFGMYSLVYLMYCTSMFILGSVCNVIDSCHTLMFWSRVSIMWTSHVKSLWVTLLLFKG